jgi:hypothetical protein
MVKYSPRYGTVIDKKKNFRGVNDPAEIGLKTIFMICFNTVPTYSNL